MAKFDTLEEDLGQLCDGMRRTIENRLGSVHGEEQKRLVRELDRAKENAESMLQSMEAEIQRSPAYERSGLRQRLGSCRRTLESTKTRMVQITRQDSDLDDMEAAQRARLLQGTRSLERASGSVQRSRVIAEETDQIATDVVGELDRQGEALGRTRDRLHETQTALDKSKTIVRGMAFRVVTNKLLMTVIIIVELGILGAVIYLKFFNKGHKKT